MKKQNFLPISILLFLISTAALADNKPKVKGYYVNNNQDTINVTIEVQLNLLTKEVAVCSFQRNFKCFEKGKEYKFNENDSQAFGFVFKGEKYDFRFVREIIIPVMGNMKPSGTFLRILESGKCDLYLVTSVDCRSEDYFFRRGDNDNYLTRNSTSMVSHDKEIGNFFADCPELAEKIKSKGFKGDDDKYRHMVQFYNKTCTSESKQEEE